uniref:Uncharacterized protein n=1 Tax=Rhabditophanes sp. KR3021 TaxID=114890 RepID=A0AC35TMC0_9BILA
MKKKQMKINRAKLEHGRGKGHHQLVPAMSDNRSVTAITSNSSQDIQAKLRENNNEEEKALSKECNEDTDSAKKSTNLRSLRGCKTSTNMNATLNNSMSELNTIMN